MAEKEAIEKDILVKIDELLDDSRSEKFKALKEKISNSSLTSELVGIRRDLELNADNWDCEEREDLFKLLEKQVEKLGKE